MSKRRWLWVLLFIFVALLLGALATGWNVVLVRDYQRILELTHSFSLTQEIQTGSSHLLFKMILGTLGFIAALGLTLLIFTKLLNEMRLNQLQSEFLAAVSHELKTPLASMELTTSLIQTGGLTEQEISQLWNSHKMELNRLKEDVEILLEAAKWQVKPSFKYGNPIHLEHWIENSMEEWKKLLGPKSILERAGVPLDSKTLVDLRTLNLITNNLINNSKKFSKDFPHVIIRTRKIPAPYPWSKSSWQIEFEDHGWGFNPADSKKIFQRFFRSRSQAPYAIPGTGLGLYLAHSASKAMGLTLKGKCRQHGQGAIFTLEGPEVKRKIEKYE